MPDSAIRVQVNASPASAAHEGPNFHTITALSTPLSSSTSGYCSEIFAWQ